jgi:hypothetical protein
MRSPDPSRAALRGARGGIGGRCLNHGGLAGTVRDFTLLPGESAWSRWPQADGTLSPRTWSAVLVPADLWSSVTRNGARDFDSEAIEAYRETVTGKRARAQLASKLHSWPCLIGLRVARRLAERGRLAHVVIDTPRTAGKLRALRPNDWSDQQWEGWIDHVALFQPDAA